MKQFDTHKSVSESSSYTIELNTGPIGPPEPPADASLVLSFLLFCYMIMNGTRKKVKMRFRQNRFKQNKLNDSGLTEARPAAQVGYSSSTMSMYFSIASSGGIAPSFCQACLANKKANHPIGC